ncbi:zf-DBF-domain-containing protein [Aspergillus ellipticus CBS 707.79]|uniref:Zf-DBF-domain-containing protein n=1 Tax=Aspergillus ellipticus CBS 707.79 TaxID=1448320 RepID=A0A319DRT8_9EURO|nr:zf-DBF-domain-containing protein [Aspergillus ellipticus CBS 707.79]
MSTRRPLANMSNTTQPHPKQDHISDKHLQGLSTGLDESSSRPPLTQRMAEGPNLKTQSPTRPQSLSGAVFYFDSIPDKIRNHFAKQVLALGAREEKFFSHRVSHVVTSRPIPPELEAAGPGKYSPGLTKQVGSNMELQQCALGSASMSLKDCIRRQQKEVDVLLKAREMRLAIWTTARLRQIITNLGESIHAGGDKNSNISQSLDDDEEEDLSRPSAHSLPKTPIPFKGYFIYVHDRTEKTRPVMIREYSRVTNAQDDGSWPQPTDPIPGDGSPFFKRRLTNARYRQPRREQYKPPHQQQQPSQRESVNRRSDHRPPIPCARALFNSYEPAASGIQPSNITSAIHSQSVSSTAAAPGTKAAVSKAVHLLSHPTPYRNSGRKTENEIRENRPGTTSHTTPRLNGPENGAEEEPRKTETLKRRASTTNDRGEMNHRVPKSGYCENCSDRYDSFDQHITTPKHRRFATNPANWADLDALLVRLQRPLKRG